MSTTTTLKKKSMNRQSRLSSLGTNYRTNFLKIVLYVALFFSWFIFKDIWYDIINKVWVIPVMSKLSGILLNAIFITFTFLLAVYYYFTCKKERSVSVYRLVLISIIAFVYINCIVSQNWNYTYIIKSLGFSYSDIVLFPLLGEIIFLIILYRDRQKIKIKNAGLEFEKILEDKENDNYQRDNYIASISSLLLHTFDDNMSFAIGVTGIWGSGKSSFINLLINKIKRDVDVIIEFKPWFCKSPTDIIDEFFKIYQNSISPYAPNIMKLIRGYAKSLMDIEPSPLIKWTNFFLDQNANKDSKTQYDTIVKELKSLKLKVVIIIDDLDRLNKDEIMEVLHLIRNGANFPYTQFLVAYDKKYVTESLSKNNVPRPAEYLAKIFNTEITLPKVEEKVICEQLHKRLIFILVEFNLSPDEIEKLAYTNRRIKDGIIYLIPKLLYSMRDVIRFSNALRLNLQPFKKEIKNKTEINVSHFFYLELIRYSFPEIYEVLRDNPGKILTEDFKEKVYRYARSINDPEKHPIDTIIASEHQEMKSEIHFLLLILFGGEKQLGNNHCIWHMKSYIKYFAYRVDSHILTLIEMVEALEEEDSLTKIKKICQNKFPDELNAKLHQCLLYVNQSQLSYKKVYKFIRQAVLNDKDLFEKEIKNAIESHINEMKVTSFDHLDNLLCLWQDILEYSPSSLSSATHRKVLMTLLFKDNLSLILHNSISEPIELHVYKTLKNVVKYSDIFDIFTNISRLSSVGKPNFILTKNDFNSIIVSNLDFHLRRIKKLTKEEMKLFSKCTDLEDENKFIDDAIAIMHAYITSHPQEYLDIFIHTTSVSNRYSISPDKYAKDIFQNNDNIKNFLFDKNLSHLKGIVKVRNFWKLYENNNYSSLILNKETVEEFENSDLANEISKVKKMRHLKQCCDKLKKKLSTSDRSIESITALRDELKEILRDYDQVKLDYLLLSKTIDFEIDHLMDEIDQLKLIK